MAKSRKPAALKFTMIDPTAFGAAFGVLEALAMFFIAVFARYGFGMGMTNMMASVYPGYGPDFTGAFIGLVLGAISGFVFGYFLASIYNYLLAKGY